MLTSIKNSLSNYFGGGKPPRPPSSSSSSLATAVGHNNNNKRSSSSTPTGTQSVTQRALTIFSKDFRSGKKSSAPLPSPFGFLNRDCGCLFGLLKCNTTSRPALLTVADSSSIILSVSMRPTTHCVFTAERREIAFIHYSFVRLWSIHFTF